MAYIGLPELPAYDFEDQGNFGTCVGNGLAHLLEYEALKYFPSRQITFSRLMIYYNSKLLEGNWDEGTYPTTATQALMTKGVCLESDYPYSLLTDVHNIPAPSKQAIQNALQFRIKSFTQLDGSVASIDKAIDQGKAINVGSIVTDNFTQAVNEGFIGLPQGSLLGGHDYVIIGRDDQMSHTFPDGKVLTGFYKIVNSWNRQQYAWVAKDFISFHLDIGMPILSVALTIETGWVAEVNPTPTPTPVPTSTTANKIELYIDKTDAYVDGHQFILDSAPKIENNITLIPVRFVGEHMGYDVSWDNNLRKVTLTKK